MNQVKSITDQVRLPIMNSRKSTGHPAQKAMNSAALAMLMAMREQYAV
jgi:hypothetical protein